MKLPEHICGCIAALEKAGYAAYAVGGCVRDDCLGLQPQDYDLCTAALPEQTQAVFANHRLVLAGKKHGTVGVVLDGDVVEITTFRTEGGYQDSRHPGWVAFVEEIESDLARRDFTVNAMAYSPTRGLIDPFGGREDLLCRRLRAVGQPEKRFREDALRILRGVRFAVRYDLTPEPETERAMGLCAPLMDNLARERAFDELCKLLPLVTAGDLLRFSPILCQVIPELAPLVGYDQKNHHHTHDLYTHTALVVEGCPGTLSLRWAALLHDIGKPACRSFDHQGQAHYHGHAEKSAELADGILRRLKAPNALREQVLTLIRQHMTLPEPEKKFLRRRLGKLGPETLSWLLALQRSDTAATGTEHHDTFSRFDRAGAILEEIQAEDACLSLKDLALNGHDLTALGYRGKAIGQALKGLLELVLEEGCENTREALTAALTHFPKEEPQ